MEVALVKEEESRATEGPSNPDGDTEKFEITAQAVVPYQYEYYDKGRWNEFGPRATSRIEEILAETDRDESIVRVDPCSKKKKSVRIIRGLPEGAMTVNQSNLRIYHVSPKLFKVLRLLG